MDQLDLVEQALNGRKDALHHLAEVSYTPLRTYVLRITFHEEITDDIVQETLLEMYRIFAQLKQADHFWPWLCKIALNKARKYTEVQNRHRRLLKLHAEQNASPPEMDGLASAINQELHQVILQCLSKLSDRQRAVLSMRCYENMPYSQIAEIMDLSELGCRLLFVRARKKLRGYLSGFGYGQKSLLLALVLFGKLTAPNEAAAAEIALSPSILNAGPAASGISLVTGKAALLTAGTAGMIAGGLIYRTPPARVNPALVPSANASFAAENTESAGAPMLRDTLFFFPQGKHGPVLTRFTTQNGFNTVHILQNDDGNFTYDAAGQSAAVHNFHYWKPDLSVMTLPTDSPDLETFVAQMERRSPQHDSLVKGSENLFVVISGQDPPRYFGTDNYNALMEERFQYNWPADSAVADDRDPLHKSGCCLVSFSGTLSGEDIMGRGTLPFTYSQAMAAPPCLEIKIGDTTCVDSPAGASVYGPSGTAEHYAAGTFLCGLNRQWTGLHVIDTVRRDAAAFRIPFSTSMGPAGQTATVRLTVPQGRLHYIIDMHRDWIEQIVFTNAQGAEIGRLNFRYAPLGQVDSLRPAPGFAGTNCPVLPGVHWLSELAGGNSLPAGKDE